MIRHIVHIDEEKCTGCGLCARACHEGAIAMVNGKARLIRDDYCDGMGDCLPECPAGAIEIIEREAAAYDEAAVKARMAALKSLEGLKGSAPGAEGGCDGSAAAGGELTWPVQIRLVSDNTSWLYGADILVAADCTGYACRDFHARYASGRAMLVGCPKLDPVDYAEKLTALFAGKGIRSILLTRMTVPCCGGMERAVRAAAAAACPDAKVTVVTLSPDGTEVARS